MMKIAPGHLKRYRQITRLLWKYGRSDLVKHMGHDDGFEPDPVEASAGGIAPEQLADDLEAMGPTYVKLGQVLAGRPDLLPESYVKALTRLQDNVKPFPFSEVEATVAAELGVRLSKVFSRFDPEPVAAASLGQVHRAALRDGRPVVVKVQRPGIQPQIAEDFEVLDQIASFLDEHTETGRRFGFGGVVEEFRTTIREELNYEREAQNLKQLGENLREFTLLRVPQPYPDFCSRTVLTMEFVQGRKITALTPLARLDLDGAALCEELFRAYLKQVLVDGLFHADPHAGNVFITERGRLALLDLGMVGHTTAGMQESLLKVLLAVSEGNGDEAAELVLRMSQKLAGFDQAEFRRRIARLVATRRDQGLEQMRVGRSLLDVSADARASRLVVPGELTLLGKTLLQLDEVCRILDPSFEPNASIHRNVNELMAQRMRKDLSKGSFFSSMLELKQFATGFPSKINRIMDAVANAELEVRVRTIDAPTLLRGMQKIANRITAGMVLASLIVGASLLMRVDTPFRILGYPGFAMLCFLGAAAGGVWLVLSVMLQDQKDEGKPPHPK